MEHGKPESSETFDRDAGEKQLRQVLIYSQDEVDRMREDWNKASENEHTLLPHLISPAESERITFLIEECAEVIQAATKIQRFGYASRNPSDIYAIPNRLFLGNELGHLLAAIELLTDAYDLSQMQMDSARKKKIATVGQWMHHQESK